MDLSNYTPLEMRFLNKYIRIISPLYGILRPFDEINEHRLDFSKNIVLKIFKKVNSLISYKPEKL